jgi:hypothetical protein
MPELKFIVKNANGRILFKDAGGNIIQDRPDYEAVGLTGELYPESITVGAGENTYSFVIPANGGITYTSVGGAPTTYTGNASGLLAILSANFFNASTGSGGGGGGGSNPVLGATTDNVPIGTSGQSPATYPEIMRGIMQQSEFARSDFYDFFQLDFHLTDFGTRFAGKSVFPDNPASLIGLLKGILYHIAPPIPTNSYFLNAGDLTIGQDFRSLLVSSQSRKITGGVFTARASANDKMLILFDYQPGATAPTAIDIRAVYVLPSGYHSVQIAPMNFQVGIWALVAANGSSDDPSAAVALPAGHASVSIFHEPTTLV